MQLRLKRMFSIDKDCRQWMCVVYPVWTLLRHHWEEKKKKKKILKKINFFGEDWVCCDHGC